MEIQDETGRKLAARRLPEGAAGIAALHELIAGYLGQNGDPGQVMVAIETDRGLWVQALAAAGYQVYGLNPKQVARFKERDNLSGAKSDAADAHALADMVRTERHQLRPVAADTPEAEAIIPSAQSRKVNEFQTATTAAPRRTMLLCFVNGSNDISSAFFLGVGWNWFWLGCWIADKTGKGRSWWRASSYEVTPSRSGGARGRPANR